MEEDMSSEEYEEEVDSESEDIDCDQNPYKRFKTQEGSVRQAERRPYGA